MPRKPRTLVDDGYYHLLARGNNRLYIFTVEGGFLKFVDLLGKAKDKYNCKFLHYCIMSNHFHLLAQIKRGLDLPKIMQYLLFEYSRWYRANNPDYVGHLWQGRYKSTLITKESYLLECGRYIERNPMRANIVKRPEEYSWSSYSYYGSNKTDRLIDEDPFYQDLGKDKYERCWNYSKFVGFEGPYESIVDEFLLEKHF